MGKRLACNGIVTADGPDIRRVLVLYRDRVSTLNELADAIHSFYVVPHPAAELRAQHLTETALGALAALRENLSACVWQVAELGQAVKQTASAAGLKMPQVAIPLRVALLGMPQSPSIDSVLEVMGRERVLQRIDAVLHG